MGNTHRECAVLVQARAQYTLSFVHTRTLIMEPAGLKAPSSIWHEHERGGTNLGNLHSTSDQLRGKVYLKCTNHSKFWFTTFLIMICSNSTTQLQL